MTWAEVVYHLISVAGVVGAIAVVFWAITKG